MIILKSYVVNTKIKHINIRLYVFTLIQYLIRNLKSVYAAKIRATFLSSAAIFTAVWDKM